MDPGQPKITSNAEMPSPEQSGLETVVRSHSVQLTKLNTKLANAFAQVTNEMGTFRTSSVSTTTTLASLSNQGSGASPPPPAIPPTPSTDPPVDPRWEPTLPPPKPFAGEFDRCRGFLGQCDLCFVTKPPGFILTGRADHVPIVGLTPSYPPTSSCFWANYVEFSTTPQPGLIWPGGSTLFSKGDEASLTTPLSSALWISSTPLSWSTSTTS